MNEESFARLIGDLDESLSGSDSSEESEEEQNASRHPDDVTLSALLKKQARISQHKMEVDGLTNRPTTIMKTPVGSPMIWFTSDKLPSDQALGIYKAVLPNSDLATIQKDPVALLQRKQLKSTTAKQSGVKSQPDASNPSSTTVTPDPHFFLCMIGGGHFAAMIVSLIPQIRRGPGGVEERHAIVLAHKTFHRYTTRRKQGGSQSANDNSKGNAHSAGSSIRRYNEAALENDVRTLLRDWKGMIDSAELCFVRATGSQSRRTLFGPYEGQILTARDPRLRGFPFTTRRPTQNELLRAFQELTRLKVSTLTEEPVSIETNSANASSTTISKPSKPSKPAPTAEESAALLHTTQITNLIRRGRAPALLIYLTKNNLSPNFQFHPFDSHDHAHAPYPLHLASSSNSPALTTALLTKAFADPTFTNAAGKTAYEIAGDRATREAFRVSRYMLEKDPETRSNAAKADTKPDEIDWNAAKVPTGVSPDDSKARAKEEEARENAAEAKRRGEELERIKAEEEKRAVKGFERKGGAGKSLSSAGGVSVEKTGAEKREEEMRGMTPEMRMRLEREKRARAAEERMRRFAGGGGGGGGGGAR